MVSPPASHVVVQFQRRRVTPEALRTMLADRPHDAARWMKAAAQAGLAPAQLVLGQLLLDGQGVARDPTAAFAWFEKAAASGDLEARNMVGRCYEQGWGVAPDPRRATESFEIAAQAGHLWGQVNLAQMLMRGGDPKDRPRCFALFRLAAESGTSKANLKAMNSLARFLEEGWAGPPDPMGALFWHHADLLGTDPSRLRQAVLRAVGALLFAASYGLVWHAWGAVIAAIGWFCLATMAAIGVVAVLTVAGLASRPGKSDGARRSASAESGEDSATTSDAPVREAAR